jgi:hypothetical protein
MNTAIAPHTESASRQISLLSADDLHLFNEGTHYDLWKKFGSHVFQHGDMRGV